MKWRIPLSDPGFGSEEVTTVHHVLSSRRLSMGRAGQEFESSFAAYVGAKHAVAVTNGTSALHLACLAAGLGPGDEAIVPSLAFVATANAVRYTGATPVFADIASVTDLNISPASIQERITNRTRAIVLFHFGGYACDMHRIKAIAGEHKVMVIEDVGPAIGSELNGCKLGTWGDIGCYNFFSNKNSPIWDCGMLTTNDDDLAQKLRLLRSHGMSTATQDRCNEPYWNYNVAELGYDYSLDEIRSALGLAQLSKLDTNNERRRQLTQFYRATLKTLVPKITLPFENYRGLSSAHLMPVLLPHGMKRFEFINYLRKQGIQTGRHYPPIHQLAFYKNISCAELPVTEDIAARELTLPLYPDMQENDIRLILQAIQEEFILSKVPMKMD